MKLNNKTILVTGGAGFIGSHFVQTWAKSAQIIVYDNFASAVTTPTQLLQFGAHRVIRGDILDSKKLASAIRGVDVVFHFAVACIRLSLSDERYVHDINAKGTLATLLAAKKADVKRFIYISSSEAYGSAQKPRISESHPMDPTTVYGMSKYEGELYTKLFNDHQGLPGIVIRPFNTYGPRSHFEGVYGEVIPRFVIRALNKKQPLIFGTGTQTRDFTYVTDTVAGIAKAAQSDKLLGSVVNIARGQEVTIKDIAKYICTLTDLSYKPIQTPPRPNDLMRHYADITKAKKLLSFKPMIGIEEGLKKYIDWVKHTYPNPKKLLTQIPTTNW
jgi:UDP-glucose 4-epimerase